MRLIFVQEDKPDQVCWRLHEFARLKKRVVIGKGQV
jgi:hypothetical protein